MTRACYCDRIKLSDGGWLAWAQSHYCLGKEDGDIETNVGKFGKYRDIKLFKSKMGIRIHVGSSSV